MPTHAPYTDVYYKILIPLPRTNNLMRICAVQDFDGYDYIEAEWLHDDDGVVSFDSEEDAKQYLADYVDPKWISPSDQLPKSHLNHWRLHHEN
jgi:hypothetical protein